MESKPSMNKNKKATKSLNKVAAPSGDLHTTPDPFATGDGATNTNMVQQQQRVVPRQRMVGRNVIARPRGGMNRNYTADVPEGDDEMIDISATTETAGKIDAKSLKYKAEEFLELTLRAAKKKIDPTKKDQIVPCLATVKAKEIQNESDRAPLDLICVIDKSGSMMGEKITLVKETFDFLYDELADNDRVSLIEFESHPNRLMGLKKMTSSGKKEARDVIESIQVSGGTNITAAMQVALETIKKRKYANKVTSILLLSDGLDGSAKEGVKRLIDQYNLTDDFTVNTFGYGNDHDADLMSSIAENKDGTFHYIENLDIVSESFADCVGGLMSVVAQNIRITVKPEMSEVFKNVKITKVFMDDRNLKENRGENPRTFTVNYSQILSGTAKDFVFMVQITNPDGKDDTGLSSIAEGEGEEEKMDTNEEGVPHAAPLGDQALLASGICEYVPLGFTDSVSINSELIVEYGDISGGVSTDAEVMINYFRAQTSECLKTADILASDNALERARKILQDHLEEMENSSLKTNERVQTLITDTRDGIGRMQDTSSYEMRGKAYFKSMARNHMMQQSTMSNVGYQNKRQGEMIMRSKAKKSK